MSAMVDPRDSAVQYEGESKNGTFEITMNGRTNYRLTPLNNSNLV